MSSNNTTRKRKSTKRSNIDSNSSDSKTVSSTPNDIAINILTKNKINVQEWIGSNDDNIIIQYIEKGKSYNFALKRFYFVNFPNNNLYLPCAKIDGKLDLASVVASYNRKELYYDLQYLLSKKVFVQQRAIIDFLKSNQKICVIQDVAGIEDSEYINYHNMLIELNYSKKRTKRMSITDDIDFHISQADKKWTYKWDTGINGLLLHGDSYFKTQIFEESAMNRDFFFYEDHIKYKKDDPRKAAILSKSRQNIKYQRDCLDITFYNTSIVSRDNVDDFYRGMTQPYLLEHNKPNRPLEIGDSTLIRTFTSTTSNIDVAVMFARKEKTKGFLYKIEPQSNVPYHYIRGFVKDEFEILFPRDLVFTLVRIEQKEVQVSQDGEREIYPIYVLSVHLLTHNQYITNDRIRKTSDEKHNNEVYSTRCAKKRLSTIG